MVEGDRYCADIMAQIASVQEALRAVGRALMRNHLRHCATQAISKGSPEEAEAVCGQVHGPDLQVLALTGVQSVWSAAAIMAFIVCYEGYGIVLRLPG